ncbi:MAG: hypothetical protein WCP58_08940, partial [bacterium]
MVEYRVKETKPSFPVKREYARCLSTLHRSGILTLLPKSESLGVIGIDGKEGSSLFHVGTPYAHPKSSL